MKKYIDMRFDEEEYSKMNIINRFEWFVAFPFIFIGTWAIMFVKLFYPKFLNKKE